MTNSNGVLSSPATAVGPSHNLPISSARIPPRASREVLSIQPHSFLISCKSYPFRSKRVASPSRFAPRSASVPTVECHKYVTSMGEIERNGEGAGAVQPNIMSKARLGCRPRDHHFCSPIMESYPCLDQPSTHLSAPRNSAIQSSANSSVGTPRITLGRGMSAY